MSTIGSAESTRQVGLFALNRHCGPLIVVAALFVSANAIAGDRPTIGVKMLETPTVIDGEIGDHEWAGAAIIDSRFIRIEPEYVQPSPFRTVVRIGQTEDSLYVAFTCHDLDSSRFVAAVTQRAGVIEIDDSVTVFLDSFCDQRTAYGFGTNAVRAGGPKSRTAVGGRLNGL